MQKAITDFTRFANMITGDKDVDTLALTIWAEARGEGVAGMEAVAWVIRNRVKTDIGRDGKPDWWGEGYEGVCKCKWQFSCWNAGDPNRKFLDNPKLILQSQLALAVKIARAVVGGMVPDPTAGATHYYATTMPSPPAWAAKLRFIKQIGRHRFYV